MLFFFLFINNQSVGSTTFLIFHFKQLILHSRIFDFAYPMESVDAVVSFLQTMNITHKHVACDASDVLRLSLKDYPGF